MTPKLISKSKYNFRCFEGFFPTRIIIEIAFNISKNINCVNDVRLNTLIEWLKLQKDILKIVTFFLDYYIRSRSILRPRFCQYQLFIDRVMTLFFLWFKLI